MADSRIISKLFSLAVSSALVLGICIVTNTAILPEQAVAEPNAAKGPSEAELKRLRKKMTRKYMGSCPAGTEAFGEVPPDGNRMWCRKPERNGKYTQHGATFQWYPNGKMRAEGDYYLGKKHGKWIRYHRNGQKKSVEEWFNGERKEIKAFDRDGKEVQTRQMRRNRKKNRSRSGTQF